MKIFKDNYLKKYKIVGLTIFGLLFIWFSFNLTGLRFGDIILVKSCFIDEPIDIIFWCIYTGCFILFILKDSIGKYAMTVYSLLWGMMQLSNYFKNASEIKSYNETFSEMHHIFGVSDLLVIKDTYHLLLDILILIAVCYGIFYIALTILKKHKYLNILNSNN